MSLIRKRDIIIFMLSFMFVSCVTNRDTRFLQKTKHEYKKADFQEYKLQVDDELVINLMSVNPEVSTLFFGGGVQSAAQMQYTYKIYSDSTIDVPYVKHIKLAGLTLREAEKEIIKKLKDYIKDEFSVKVILSNRVYYMFGDAGKGQYSIYKDRLNIFEALAQTGNMGLSANRRAVKLIRKSSDGIEKIYEFDIRSKSIVDSEFYYIQPNDILYVDRSKSSFYKISNFTSFVGMITSTLSFVLIVAQYSN